MKCICGYKGGDFECLTMVNVCTSQDSYMRMEGIKDGKTTDVYVCPKCGTLKIEVEK